MERIKLVRTGKTFFLALTVACGLAVSAPTELLAQAPRVRVGARRATGFINRVFRDATGEHKYVLFVPSNYAPSTKWPIILYLHGAGERGTDGLLQTQVGLGPFVKARGAQFPYLVVFPQCEDTQVPILQAWAPTSADGKRALAILSQVEREFSIDAHRRVLTGWSMGGYGTWSLGAADATHWAAIAPVSGGGDPASASRLKNASIWAFAGANDRVVAPRETQQMVDAVRAAGGHPRFTIVPDVGHEVWKTVYSDERFYSWLKNPTADGPADLSGDKSTTEPSGAANFSANAGAPSPAQPNLEGPFVPALSIPNAIAVRLGNDALKAIAHSAPKMIPADSLTGSINDIYSSTESSGYTFSVQFSRISYSGQVARAYIKAYAPDHLNLQLALRATMTIGATYVSGSGKSAYAGPISVAIGTRSPVWLGIDVTPYVQDARLRLRYNSARFEIPSDNWYVTAPYGVSTQGLGMTQERVSSGLVQGIYGQKSRIEQEVQSIVPFLLSKVEERLDLNEVSQVANAFWPLPVYRPRLQVWPQSVRTDDQGISLVMGVTAAAIDPRKAPSGPRVERPAGVEMSAVGHDADLRVGVAPDVLEPLTRMLIEDGVARINVLDIPDKSFAAFADRKALTQVLPDLASLPEGAQVWAELSLASPITVRDADSLPASKPNSAVVQKDKQPSSKGKKSKTKEAEPIRVTAMKATATEAAKKDADKSLATAAVATPTGNRAFDFVVPRAVISIAVKDSPADTKWKPYAEFEVDLSQRATATLLRRGFAERGLRIDWAGDPVAKAAGHFAAGVSPKNPEIRTEKLHDLFVSAWKTWTHKGPAAQVAVSDVDFQYAKLRLDGVDWSPPVLSVTFDEPGIKITNTSKTDLVYENKDIYSPWSEPLTLKPGKSHEYKVAEPLLFRRVNNGDFSQMFTLPVGFQYEYRSPPTGGQPTLFRVHEPAAAH